MTSQAQDHGEYLLKKQYADGTNLLARMGLHARFSTNKSSWQKWVFSQLDLPREATILELGCGPGRFWRENIDRVCESWRITLTDFSPGMLEEAESGLRALGKEFTFKVANAQAVPFPDGTFDCVIANHMLYHVPDPDAAIAEIARVLKTDGLLMAATNGENHMGELLDIIRRVIPEFQPESQSFTLEKGAGLLQRHFRQVEIRRYEDSLIVTEAEALKDYVRSMSSLKTASAIERDQILALIDRQFQAQGKMEIRKDTGAFLARREP